MSSPNMLPGSQPGGAFGLQSSSGAGSASQSVIDNVYLAGPDPESGDMDIAGTSGKDDGESLGDFMLACIRIDVLADNEENVFSLSQHALRTLYDTIVLDMYEILT
jgi:hypothetical protein